MPHFVDDLTDLPEPKTQITPVPPGEEDNSLSADDYNEVRQAAYDLRERLLDALTPASSILIERVGNAPDVNLSTLGTIDWFIAHTTAVTFAGNSANNAKYGGGFMWRSFSGATGGQATSTTLMNATTRSSTAADDMALAASGETNSWGVTTPNASSAFGIGFQAPSGGGLTRELRVYCANTLSVARLTCRLDDGTEMTIDSDNNGPIQTHEYKVTYTGASILSVTWREISRYAGTHQLAFAGASLGLAA